METTRRSLLVGLGCIIAAPAIVRASSLMKVKPLPGDGPWKCTYRELPTQVWDISRITMQVRRDVCFVFPHVATPYTIEGTDFHGHPVSETVWVTPREVDFASEKLGL